MIKKEFVVTKIKIRDLIKKIKDGTISMNLPIQRKFVWSKKHIGELVHSIFDGISVGVITIVQREGQLYILDGKQRCTSLFMFIEDAERVQKVDDDDLMIEYLGKEISLIGRCFSELPEELQEYFLDYELDIIEYDEIDIKKMCRVFNRCNDGVKLSDEEFLRSTIYMNHGKEMVSKLDRISTSCTFLNNTGLTSNGMLRGKDFSIMIKTLLIGDDNYSNKSFSGANTKRYAANITWSDIDKLDRLTGYVNSWGNDWACKCIHKNTEIKDSAIPLIIAASEFASNKATYLVRINKYFDKTNPEISHDIAFDAYPKFYENNGTSSASNVLRKYEIIKEIALGTYVAKEPIYSIGDRNVTSVNISDNVVSNKVNIK